MDFIKSTIFTAILTVASHSLVFAQQPGTIRGEVADSLGLAVVGATVKVSNSSGFEKMVETGANGSYRITGLVPGKYSLEVSAPSFAVYKSEAIEVTSGLNAPFKVVLEIEEVSAEVDISNEGQVNTDADSNASALVLKEDELEALPDDPDDLEAALQALAGGGAGPNGGQIYIDGFEGGNLPPKEAIREIRINRDPFSAEYDRMGFGRIEILTKPGALKFSGQVYFNFNDDVLNARNPFSENKADSQRKFYGGYVSAPIVKNKASFSLGFNVRDQKEGTSVNATVVDDSFNLVPFQQEFTEPRKRFSFNPRFDFGINDKNTVILRYDYSRNTSDNFGGGFTLPTRSSSSESTSQTFQATETAIINAKTVNETRFQYRINNRDVLGNSNDPAINVLGAFNGGGSTTGTNFNNNKFWELQNYTTTALGKNSEHGLKFGIKVRGRSLEDRTESNYNGTFTFTGFLPNAPSPYDLDGNGYIESIEQYRAKLLGETDPLFDPTQFSITTGNPLADIKQYDVGLFIKDDWRVGPGLTLNYGIRYENQTNLSDSLNFAPRFGFAYSPGAGGAKPPKFVFRGGLGIFYTRFSENLTLQAQRLDGVSQQQYIVGGDDPLLSQAIFSLNGVTNVPTVVQLANVAPLSSTPRIISDAIQAPYTIQGAFSVERQLPGRTTISAYYMFNRSLHLIRSRNINAPVCAPGDFCPVNDPVALQALRPDPLQGNIYQTESSGVSNSQRLFFRFSTIFSRSFTMFAGYFLGKTKSNSDGGFPSYSYDLANEYSNSSRDVRQTFFLVGSFRVPYGISLRPFVIARTGSPFNITTGQDLNGDSIFNDRPTFGQLAAACAVNGITDSWCDVSGNDQNAIIPRNFGRGPGSITVNLSLDKTIGFGSTGRPNGNQEAREQERRSSRGGSRRGGGRRGGFGGRGGRGSFGGGGERKPYNLTLGVRFRNLFNRTNPNNPVGNIGSPAFGDSTNISGGFRGSARTIEFRTRFRW